MIMARFPPLWERFYPESGLEIFDFDHVRFAALAAHV